MTYYTLSYLTVAFDTFVIALTSYFTTNLCKLSKPCFTNDPYLLNKFCLQATAAVAASETMASMAARVLGELQHVFSTEARLGGATTDVSSELTEEVVRVKRNHIVLHGVGHEGLQMRALLCDAIIQLGLGRALLG